MMIGKTISHYKILEELGRGGMGVVYKAEDTKLKRTVALKFLSPQSLGSEEEKTRFVHEAQAAAALDHSNICTVYEFDEADGNTFIAMAYIEGQSLKKKIEANLPKVLNLREVLDYAIQIAEGLQAAHEKGIVHRDIKSANIMLTKRGQAKVMDFGLAKSYGGTQLTRTGTTLGTLAYMSPEQVQGMEVDHRTDIWSYGILLYELVCGDLPFKSKSELAVVYPILTDNPPRPTSICPDMPSGLEAIILRCLEKEREQRFSHVEEIIAELKHVKQEILIKDISSSTSHLTLGLPPKPKRKIGGWAILAIGLVFISILSYFLIQIISKNVETKIGRNLRITHSPALEIDPAISPDGKLLAYAAGTTNDMKIYVRQISGGRAIALSAGLPGYHRWPQWSPDGNQIAFHCTNATKRIYVVPALGGTPKPLIENASGFGLAWSPDGKQIAYVLNNRIYVQSVNSDKPRERSLKFTIPIPYVFRPTVHDWLT